MIDLGHEDARRGVAAVGAEVFAALHWNVFKNDVGESHVSVHFSTPSGRKNQQYKSS